MSEVPLSTPNTHQMYYVLTMFSPNRQAMLAFKHRLAADAILSVGTRPLTIGGCSGRVRSNLARSS